MLKGGAKKGKKRGEKGEIWLKRAKRGKSCVKCEYRVVKSPISDILTHLDKIRLNFTTKYVVNKKKFQENIASLLKLQEQNPCRRGSA